MGRSFFACWYVCLRGVYDHLCSVRALAAVCVRLDVSCRLFQELLRTSCRAVPLPLRWKRKTHTNRHKHAHTSSEQPPPPQIPPPPPPSLSQLQLLIFSVQAAACLSMCVRVCDGDRQSVCVCVRASMCVSAYWENRCEVQSPRLPFKFSFPPLDCGQQSELGGIRINSCTGSLSLSAADEGRSAPARGITTRVHPRTLSGSRGVQHDVILETNAKSGPEQTILDYIVYWKHLSWYTCFLDFY